VRSKFEYSLSVTMNDEGNWITIGGRQDGQGKVKVFEFDAIGGEVWTQIGQTVEGSTWYFQQLCMSIDEDQVRFGSRKNRSDQGYTCVYK